MTVVNNGLEIAKAIRDGTAIAVSDGSFKDSQGTAAFILEGSLPAGQIVGVNVIPGAEESQSAYQSELGGVTGILEALHCIYRAHNITYGKVEVGLDGDQARKEAFGTWPLGPSRPDFDLIVHIRGRMIRLSPWGSRPDGSNHTKIILSHSLHSAAGKTERGMRRSCQKLLELECFSKLLASQHPVWSQEMGTMNQQEETVGSRQKKGFMPLPLRSVRKSTGTKKSSFPPELITSINCARKPWADYHLGKSAGC
jgi:hypothetical protein